MNPIYRSTPYYNNFYGVIDTSGNILASKGVGGTGGTGLNASFSLANNDDAYLVFPGYGLKVYDGTPPYFGSPQVNFENTTSQPAFVRGPAGHNNQGDSCRIYYNGVELV